MKLLYWTVWVLSRTLATVIFRLKITGREQVPKSGAFILASNHISYYDPLLVGSCCTRELFFFAKRELFKNKLFGWVLRKTNARPVRRDAIDRSAIETAIHILKKGYGLTVFPEGTRSRTEDFLPVKPGVGMIALQAGVCIVPTYIHGANQLKRCLLGKEKLRVAYGEPIPVQWVTSFEPTKESYKTISQEIFRRIALLKQQLLASR